MDSKIPGDLLATAIKRFHDRDQLIARSMLSPATCCLVNPDRERTVEQAFAAVNQMAEQLRDQYASQIR